MSSSPAPRWFANQFLFLSLVLLLLGCLPGPTGWPSQYVSCLDEDEAERERNLPAIATPTSVKVTGDVKRYGRRHAPGGTTPMPMQLSVLVETVDGHVHAFDAVSGEKLWKTKTGGSLVTSSIANTRQRERDSLLKAAIVPGVDGHLYSIKPGSQAISKLDVHASDVVQVSPNIAGDGSIVLGSKKDTVVVMHPLTGQVLAKLSGSQIHEEPEKYHKTMEEVQNSLLIGGVEETATTKTDPSSSSSDDELSDPNQLSSDTRRVTDQEQDPTSASSRTHTVESSTLQPVMLSRTEYVIKAFGQKLRDELWNVSFTDCKQLSAAEGVTALGMTSQSQNKKVHHVNSNGNGNNGKNKDWKRFMQVARNLKVVATKDNTIQVASTMFHWSELWSEQLESTPVFASLSDSVSGHTHNIQLWSDEDQKSQNQGGNILVGVHADGIFIVPELKEDSRFEKSGREITAGGGGSMQGGLGAKDEDDGSGSGSGSAVPIPIGASVSVRLSHTLQQRGMDSALVALPLEDGSGDLESLRNLPVIIMDDKKEARNNKAGSNTSNWSLALVTLVFAVAITYGGYFYENYLKLSHQIERMQKEKEEEPKIGASISNRRKIADDEVAIGRLVVKPKILGYGSAGTIVFDGVLNHREVAVKRLLREFYLMAEKEIKTLIASDAHPSVVRCYAMEEDEEFIYLALEKCQGTLTDFIASSDYTDKITQERAAPHTQLLPNPTDWAVFESRRISIPPLLLGMLSDMSNALHSLHKKGIVHRDLKPQNVLLTESKQVKLSDMGLSKQLLAEQSSFDGTGLGSPGWQAPEVLLQKQKYLQGQHSIKSSSSSAAPQQFRITTIKESEKENTDASDGSASSLVDSANCSTAGSIKANTGIRHTRAVDVFSLGCVICYTLTREHPFGTIIDRDRNILLGKYDLKAFRAMKVEASATSTSDRDSRGDDAVKEEDKVEQGKLEEGKEANPAEQEQAEIVKPLDSTNREAQEEEDDKKEKDDEGNDASGDASEGESKDSPVVEEEAKPEAEAKAEPPSASLQKPTDSQIDAKKSNSSSTSWKKSKLELLAYINYFEAENLVEAMLHTDPRKRPSMDAVIAHPFWWSAEKRISFISDFSHRMENEDRATDPRLIGLLEMYSWQGLNKRAWNKQIDTVLWEESKKFRNYSVDSLRDLIRFIRNKVSHFRDNSPEIKVLLGSMPDGLYNYFGSRFPRLLMALYSFTIMYLRTEPLLQKYFPDGLSAEQMSCFLLPQGEPLKPTGMETGVFVEQEAPSRPGEEVCQHYKQTGFCRYGSQCKFDHPAEFRVEKNSIGLPVRPDAPECDYFARQGICKYGQSCRFNHPEKYIRKKKSSVSKETTMATAEGSDATTPQQLPQQSGGGELTNHNQRRPSTERGERERQTSSHATTDRYNNHSNNSSRSRQTDSYGSRGPRGSQSSRKIYRSDAPGRW